MLKIVNFLSNVYWAKVVHGDSVSIMSITVHDKVKLQLTGYVTVFMESLMFEKYVTSKNATISLLGTMGVNALNYQNYQ